MWKKVKIFVGSSILTFLISILLNTFWQSNFYSIHNSSDFAAGNVEEYKSENAIEPETDDSPTNDSAEELWPDLDWIKSSPRLSDSILCVEDIIILPTDKFGVSLLVVNGNEYTVHWGMVGYWNPPRDLPILPEPGGAPISSISILPAVLMNDVNNPNYPKLIQTGDYFEDWNILFAETTIIFYENGYANPYETIAIFSGETETQARVIFIDDETSKHRGTRVFVDFTVESEYILPTLFGFGQDRVNFSVINEEEVIEMMGLESLIAGTDRLGNLEIDRDRLGDLTTTEGFIIEENFIMKELDVLITIEQFMSYKHFLQSLNGPLRITALTNLPQQEQPHDP